MRHYWQGGGLAPKHIPPLECPERRPAAHLVRDKVLE